MLNFTNWNQIWSYIPEIFIEISILIQVLELSNMNNVYLGEIFTHPTPMSVLISKSFERMIRIINK